MTKAFVVGHPIAHSRSPAHPWLLAEASTGLEGSYERDRRGSRRFRRASCNRFGARGFAGGNVTIPHKEAAFAAVAQRTRRAERLRAVNTLWFEDGALCGDNTDVSGLHGPSRP